VIIDRLCTKILENAEEEEMTPMQRFQATWQGKPKDRLFIDPNHMPPYAGRTLDSFADAIKPVDLYKHPKLCILAHLALTARFKLDMINWYTWCYTEELWGADARLVDYATPQQVGGPPIKTLEDLEGVEVADPKKHGLYPGYLWGVKELRRIMAKYGVDKVMPLAVSYCGDPLGTVHLGMTGFGPGMVMAKKDQPLFKACMEKAAEWSIKYGNAVKEHNPDAIYLCSYMGAIPPKMGKKDKQVDNEWIINVTGKVGTALAAPEGQQPYMYHQCGAAGWEEWMRLYYPNKAVGPGTFGGWWIGPEMPYEEVHAYSREMNLYCGCSIDDHTVLEGDMNDIEELLTPRAKLAKLHPKHCLALGVIDYWTPHSVFEKTLEMAKRLGKF